MTPLNQHPSDVQTIVDFEPTRACMSGLQKLIECLLEIPRFSWPLAIARPRLVSNHVVYCFYSVQQQLIRSTVHPDIGTTTVLKRQFINTMFVLAGKFVQSHS